LNVPFLFYLFSPLFSFLSFFSFSLSHTTFLLCDIHACVSFTQWALKL
jgi:hypothetical protein